MQWVSDMGSMASQAMSSVGNYFQDNQWAADALAGGAAAGLNYMAQKDEQEFKENFQRRQEERAWDKRMHLAEAPNIDTKQYDWSDLASGSLTDGGLIAGAQK